MSSEEKLDHLIRQGQFREAVAYLNAKSALSALDLLSLGRILTMQGKVEEALDVLNRAEAPESNDSFGAELFLARTDAWSRSRQPGAPEQARRCLEKAEGLDSTPRIQGLIALKRGALAIRESDHERAMPLLHTARTLLEDHPNEHVQVLDATGGYWAGLGDAARALAYFNRAILEKKEIEDLYGLAISHGRVGRLHLRLGEPALAEAALTEDLRLCRQMGDERAAALCLNDLARVAIFRGDGNAAMELLTEVAPLVQAGSMGEAFLHKDRAAAALLIDDLALAENALHTSRELFGNSPGDYAEAFLNQVQASLDAKRGQLAQACRGL